MENILIKIARTEKRILEEAKENPTVEKLFYNIRSSKTNRFYGMGNGLRDVIRGLVMDGFLAVKNENISLTTKGESKIKELDLFLNNP